MSSESYARLHYGQAVAHVVLQPLQVAEIAASACGYYDVDLKDNDDGHYTIVAKAEGKSITAKGKTMKQAVNRLLETMYG